MTRESFIRGGALGAGMLAAVGLADLGAVQARSAEAQVAALGDEAQADDPCVFDYEFDGVKTKTVSIQSGDNKLVGTLQVPVSVPMRPAPLILMVHGANGTRNSDIFNNLGIALAKDGYAMARFDFHGHGDSEGEFGDSTVETNLIDMDQIIAWAQGLPWCDGLALIGHSVGGAESAMYAARNPGLFKAVMLIAPALNIAETSVGILKGTAERRPWMSDAYVEDGLKFDVYQEIEGYEGPVCVVHGTQDVAVSHEYTLRLFEMIESCDIHLLAGASHIPNDRIAEIYSIAKDFFARTLVP